MLPSMGSINPAALIAFRERMGLSRNQFAKRIGMNHGTYGRIEAGAQKPRPETILLIATNLGVDPAAITNPRWECPDCGRAKAA